MMERLNATKDNELSFQLRQKLNKSNDVAINISVPQNIIGSQLVFVQVPGSDRTELVQIPPGISAGDTFTFISSSPNVSPPPKPPCNCFRVRIPGGLGPGECFPVFLPNGDTVSVNVPFDAREGNYIDIDLDKLQYNHDTSAMQSTSQRDGEGTDASFDGSAALSQPFDSNRTSDSQREREEFLAALPPDIRAEVLAQEEKLSTTEVFDTNNSKKNNLKNREQDMDSQVLRATVPGSISSIHGKLSDHDSLSNLQDLVHDTHATSSINILSKSSENAACYLPPSSQSLPKHFGESSAGLGLSSKAKPSTFKKDEDTGSAVSVAVLKSDAKEPINLSSKLPVEQLKEVKAMLDRGDISEEEFAQLKKSIIAAL